METKEYTFVDKSDWAIGPWTDEPDKVQWLDADTGLPCLAVRNSHSGNWCGYVGVDDTHPLHGVSYNRCGKETCEDDYCKSQPILTAPMSWRDYLHRFLC